MINLINGECSPLSLCLSFYSFPPPLHTWKPLASLSPANRSYFRFIYLCNLLRRHRKHTDVCVTWQQCVSCLFCVHINQQTPGTKALSSRTLKPFTPLILPIHSKQDYVLMLTRSNILRFLHIWRESVPLLTILCLQFDEDCLFFCQPHNKS